MSALAVWATAVGAWRLVVADAGRLLRLLWPWLLAYLGAEAVMMTVPAVLVAQELPMKFVSLASLLLVVVGAILAAPINTAIIRWVIAGPQSSAPLGRREGWYFLTQALLFLLFSVSFILLPIVGIVYALSVKAASHVPPLGAVVIGIIALIMTLIIILTPLVYARLTLTVVPVALGTARIDLAGAWRHSRGNSLRILFCLILAWLPLLVVWLALFLLTMLFHSASSWVEALSTWPMVALQIPMGGVWMGVGSAVVASIYRNLSLPSAVAVPSGDVAGAVLTSDVAGAVSPSARRWIWGLTAVGLSCAVAVWFVASIRPQPQIPRKTQSMTSVTQNTRPMHRIGTNTRPVTISFRLIIAGESNTFNPTSVSQILNTASFVNSETGHTVRVLRGDVFNNDMIKSARVITRSDKPVVEITLNSLAVQAFSAFIAKHVGQSLAILVNDQMVATYSIREPVNSDTLLISGNFTHEQAEWVAQGIMKK
ncbi:MAG: hypothetical protein HQL37_14805 [Alphaproteobacteria bacterium]|nr:hypothetical protein [Alphaproteobacteria bacterium]